MAAWRNTLLLTLTLLAGGCRSTGERGGGEPYQPHPVRGGFLLQTGHIQLGPRTGQNAVRWQGDGQNWLEFSGSSKYDSE